MTTLLELPSAPRFGGIPPGAARILDGLQQHTTRDRFRGQPFRNSGLFVQTVPPPELLSPRVMDLRQSAHKWCQRLQWLVEQLPG